MQRSFACFVPLRGTKQALRMTDLHVKDLDEIKDGWITRVSILAPTGIKEATPKASEPNILDGVKRGGGEVRIRFDRRKKAG